MYSNHHASVNDMMFFDRLFLSKPYDHPPNERSHVGKYGGHTWKTTGGLLNTHGRRIYCLFCAVAKENTLETVHIIL